MVGVTKHQALVLASACALVGAVLPGAVAAQQATDFSGCITGSQQFYKSGDTESRDWENDLLDTGQDSSEDIEIAPDGTIWWADRTAAA